MYNFVGMMFLLTKKHVHAFRLKRNITLKWARRLYSLCMIQWNYFPNCSYSGTHYTSYTTENPMYSVDSYLLVDLYDFNILRMTLEMVRNEILVNLLIYLLCFEPLFNKSLDGIQTSTIKNIKTEISR